MLDLTMFSLYLYRSVVSRHKNENAYHCQGLLKILKSDNFDCPLLISWQQLSCSQLFLPQACYPA